MKGHGCLAASPTIGMDTPVRSSLQVESKDSTTLKRKLHYVDGANTSEGITSCDARYTEMETSGLVSVMAADLPDVQSVEPLFASLSDSRIRFRVLVAPLILKDTYGNPRSAKAHSATLINQKP